MDIQNEVRDIESRLSAADVSVDDFCLQAKIHRSNWQRWKAGVTTPTWRNWNRILEAVPEKAA